MSFNAKFNKSFYTSFPYIFSFIENLKKNVHHNNTPFKIRYNINKKLYSLKLILNEIRLAKLWDFIFWK